MRSIFRQPRKYFYSALFKCVSQDCKEQEDSDNNVFHLHIKVGHLGNAVHELGRGSAKHQQCTHRVHFFSPVARVLSWVKTSSACWLQQLDPGCCGGDTALSNLLFQPESHLVHAVVLLQVIS